MAFTESTYTVEIGSEICQRTAESNHGLVKICKDMGLSYRTVRHWIRTLDDFQEMYRAAKEDQADFLIEDMLTVADEPSKDLIEAQDKKVRVDTRKFIAAKLKPKMYGDNRSLEVDVKVRKVLGADQMAELRRGLIAKLDAPKEDFEDADTEEV